MKYLICALMVIALAGCDQESNRQTAARWSDVGQRMADRAGEVCMKGVTYYISFYDRSAVMTPAFNQDSTVKTCAR